MLGQEQADGRSQACQRHARVIGSGLIVFGSTKFDEYGSGSSPDPGQSSHQIDFNLFFRFRIENVISYEKKPIIFC